MQPYIHGTGPGSTIRAPPKPIWVDYNKVTTSWKADVFPRALLPSQATDQSTWGKR